MSIFGFSTEPSTGGDFTPIVKYDARAGRIFRMDRIDTGNGFESSPVDITGNFKALVDFENVEVGWIDFPIGSMPSFHLVPLALIKSGNAKLPERPSEKHKNGIRFLLKLSKDCGGDKPIREIAGTSKAFLSGIEAVYTQYLGNKDANPGKLPVIMLEKTTPVTSGSGQRSSTNYHPTFKIVGWALRGDLLPQAKPQPAQAQPANEPSFGMGNGAAAPATGGQRVQPPAQQAVAVDDFG